MSTTTSLSAESSLIRLTILIVVSVGGRQGRCRRLAAGTARGCSADDGGFQRHFPVVENDRIIGILNQSGAIAASGSLGDTVPFREAMAVQIEKAHPAEMISNGCLVGLLTTDSIGEYLALRLAH